MPSQNPGIFRDFAAAREVEFTEIDLHAGEVPPDPADFDGLWVMGGSMNTWDEAAYPWLRAEKALIRDAVAGHGLPFFGICLGHQILSIVLGAKTEKMLFGHHGANHPVRDMTTKRVEITSQNHSFAVDGDSDLTSENWELDTDFDGLGDGPALGFEAQTFVASIAGTGSNLTIRVASTADGSSEDFWQCSIRPARSGRAPSAAATV